MIHVCYGLYDRDGHYSKFVGTSMASVFENTDADITVHILHDNTLTTVNRDKFIYLSGRYTQHVQFYNVENLAANQILQFKKNLPSVLQSSYSIATLYRLLMPALIPTSVTKIIYLDADIIVNLNINELWQTDMNEAPLAAVPEIAIDLGFHQNKSQKYLITSGLVDEQNYFNAGVLLFDLEYLREHPNCLEDGYKFVCEHPQCQLFDQDILNYCFARRMMKLSDKFDRFINTERMLQYNRRSKKAIYHYVANSLRLDLNDQFNRLYFDYFTKTPWFDLENVESVFKSVDVINRAYANVLVNLTKLFGKRDRAFFTEHNNIPAVKALFEIGDQEMIVDASNSDALMKILNALRPPDGQRKKIFFIFSGSYPAFKNFLVSQKFVEGIDFVNAMPFVSYILGMPTESHSIVRAM
ncbi:MAG: hypothetical protein IJ668_02840 [Selenomonadaceae bacterium]|nr:hypothetical protein [Selenomonadaceae bacterium]